MPYSKTSHSKSIVQIFLSVLIALGLLLVVSPKKALAACNFYSSMTTTVKNVSFGTLCTIAAGAVEGIDNATSDSAALTNTATLTLTANSVTISNTGKLVAGKLVLSGGSVAIQAGGALEVGHGVWVTDGDADGWAGNFTTFYDATAAGKRKLGLMDSYSVVDCSDAAFSLTNTCYAYAQAAYYAYAQAAYYAYGQSNYYSYSQGTYYGYGQGTYYGYGQSYYSGCFLQGTSVLMADGSTKNIQDIKSGDVVLSYNVMDKSSSPETVFRLLTHENIPGGYYIINNDLKVTGNHLVWSESAQKWVHVEALKVGDRLMDSNGQAITISSITKVEGTNTVYNLSLMGPNHTYFADGALVHNWKL